MAVAVVVKQLVAAEGIAERELGEERWLAGYGKALPSPGGRPERMMGVVMNITARRRAGVATGTATLFDRLGPIGSGTATGLVNPGFRPPKRG